MALLASEALFPTTLGTVPVSSGAALPRYKMTLDPPGTAAPEAGICAVTVSPSPTVRLLSPFFRRVLSAASTVMPDTWGVTTSTAADSSAVYFFSTPI